ncbi:sulfur carrier protein ThiS [Thermoproteota archaeon]
MMKSLLLTINGKNINLALEKQTVTGLLQNLQINPAGVIIEHNKSLYKNPDFDHIHLTPNDSVEILHFMGGG